MKILIISHNPLSEQSNMGKTLLSLFCGFRKEQLCQLYIYPTVPNAIHCGSYFRITDKQALRSIFGGQDRGGQVRRRYITPQQGLFEKPSDARIYRRPKNKTALRQLLRDLMWKCARWYSPALELWLREQQPDCIFVAPGTGKFLYDFALRISRERKIPIVTYLCDEHYFVPTPLIGLERLRLWLLRRKMDQLLQRSAHLVVISQELKENYSRRFGLPVSVVMTGATLKQAFEMSAGKPRRDVCYFGNVRCGRYHALEQVGKALELLNCQRGTHYRLKIYTPETDPQIRKVLESHRCMQLEPFLLGDAFEKALGSADVLLHVEAFDSACQQMVKHSVSTKIPDSLASGIPLLAYGPAGIASMNHLQRNGCAITATCAQELPAALHRALTDDKLRRQVVEKAKITAKHCHNARRNGIVLRQILEESTGKRPYVLQVNNVYGSQSTGTLTKMIHRGLRSRGWRSAVVYGRGKGVDESGVWRLCPDWYGKLQGFLLRLSGLPYGGCLLSTGRLIRMIRKEQPDIVHLQCINGHFVNIYRLVRWLNRQKIATVVSLHAEFMYTAGCGHAFGCEGWLAGCRNCRESHGWFWNRAAASWKRMAAAFAGFESSILCPVSDWTLERARRAPILQGRRFCRVYNGVDTHVFCREEISANAGYVLHVTAHFSGREDHPKGGWQVLQLAKRMPAVQFLVAGPGEKIKELPPNVKLLGNVSDPKVLAQYYRGAGVTLITSRAETFGLPCAESLCCGTPVAGYCCGGMEEIALPGYSSFVPYGDLEQLERQVTAWLSRRDLDRQKVANEAAKKYGAQQMLQEWEQVYVREFTRQTAENTQHDNIIRADGAVCGDPKCGFDHRDQCAVCDDLPGGVADVAVFGAREADGQ